MEVEEILALLSQERKKRAQWRYLSLFFGVMLGVFLPVCMLHWHAKPGFWNIYVVLVPLAFFASSKAASQKHQAAVAMLYRFDDIRGVGPLAEALEIQNKDVVPFAEQTLIRLLPRLKASDAPLLNAQQRACLNRALKKNGTHDDLRLAILKAWEQVGDASAIPFVETLAKGEAGRIPKFVAVAARECLPFLLQSTQRQQIGSQLLRPSENPPTTSEELLRPATPHVSREPVEQLLRPHKDTLS